jgi:hypothetical protein
MNFYENGKIIPLETAFKDIINRKLLKGLCSTKTHTILKDRDGRAYKVTLQIETFDYAMNQAVNKKGSATQEIKLLKKSLNEVDK